MSTSIESFLRSYVGAIVEGHAALFVGSGLSRASGFVDWKGLLRECAEELGLDLDREHDFVAVAQYYLNRRQGDRSRLNQILRNAFDKTVAPSRNHQIVARLPISTIWTTNFDSLLEQALTAAGRNVDAKSRDRDIATARKATDVTLFKMHGDIARPEEIVICKQDYERYSREHPIFQNALKGDLVSKTFLFLGFSFTDSNLDYVLGHLNTLLEGSKREHYAVIRRARLDWHKKKSEAQRLFDYEQNRQALLIEDLQRYSIQTVLIDQYEQVTSLLQAVERRVNVREVFVSGSAHEFGDFGENRMRDFCMHLGEQLIERDFRIVCGMGLSVGDAVVKGALVRMFEIGQTSMEQRVSLSPFPRNLPEHVSEVEFNRRYRSTMIGKSGVAIFIAGTSRSARESVGVLQEYEMVRAMGKIPIPVGATGFAARRIWEEVNRELGTVFSGVVTPALFARLNDPSLNNDELLDAVFDVIARVESGMTIAASDPPSARRKTAGRPSRPIPSPGSRTSTP